MVSVNLFKVSTWDDLVCYQNISNQSWFVMCAEYNSAELQWNAYLQALTNSEKNVLGEQ